MAQVLPTQTVNRWYRLRRPLSDKVWQFFAEWYFDSEQEAFAYWEQRRNESKRKVRPLNVWSIDIVTSYPVQDG